MFSILRRGLTASSVLAALGSLALGSAASGPRVAVLGAEISTCETTDVWSRLDASGRFLSVTPINVFQTTPTLAELQHYDAVLVWSNFGFADPLALGDRLADYVDAGGGVVVATFAVTSTTTRRLGGRWQTGYEVILGGGGVQVGQAGLGTVFVPNHPAMAGVSTFDGGSSSYRPFSTVLEVGATLIAQWNDGSVLVAEGANPQRIDLGFYPPSDSCFANYWNGATDGDVLMANALVQVASIVPPPCTTTTYCTSGTTSNGCRASISGVGTPSATAGSGYSIRVSGMEGVNNGILFYGISGPNAAPWGAGSTSYLCVKAPIQRTGLQLGSGTPGLCDGGMALDWNQWIATHPGKLGVPFPAGCRVWAQGWFRDPPAPRTTSLSNGIEFVTCH
jgi:hypothetical protein